MRERLSLGSCEGQRLERKGHRSCCEGQGYRQKFIHGCGVQRSSFMVVED